MDETEAQLARVRIARQRAMAFVQQFIEATDRRVEVFRGVVIVMQVDFDLSVTLRAQRGDFLQVFLEVFLLGIEEAVLRRSPIGVAMGIGQ